MRYPLVELLTVALFVLHYLVFGWTSCSCRGCCSPARCSSLFAIDLEHHLLPDAITLPGIVVGLACQPLPAARASVDALIGVARRRRRAVAIGEAYYRYAGEEGMGGGDVKMLAMIGAFLGWKLVLVTLVFSSVAGSIIGVLVIATQARRHEVRAAVRHLPGRSRR